MKYTMNKLPSATLIVEVKMSRMLKLRLQVAKALFWLAAWVLDWDVEFHEGIADD